MKTILHWFRRDLRLSDNTSLHHASRDAERVVMVFCFDPSALSRKDAGARQTAFLLEALRSLAHRLQAMGHHLHIVHGNPHEELPRLARAVDASALYWNRDYEPHALARDHAVEAVAGVHGLETRTFTDSVMHPPGQPLNGQGLPYTVFTPFSKAWRALAHPPVLPAFSCSAPPIPQHEPARLPTLKDLGFSEHPPIWPASEQEAHERLARFLDRALAAYPQDRDFPAVDGTSKLSPYLHCGLISPRTVFHQAASFHGVASSSGGLGSEVFINELIWREFYVHILAHFPHVAEGAFRQKYKGLPWPGNPAHFQAWQAGMTGYPLVDAAMRQLNTTGWMHNRLRMVVAMFLCKDLLIDWRWGERYFMRQLLDGDLAANNGGWQWSASTGTDASPYFRVFSPIRQSRKFDPAGTFIRDYIPELASLPDSQLHAPWEEGIDTRRFGYPQPLVNHSDQRKRVLELFQNCPATTSASPLSQ